MYALDDWDLVGNELKFHYYSNKCPAFYLEFVTTGPAILFFDVDVLLAGKLKFTCPPGNNFILETRPIKESKEKCWNEVEMMYSLSFGLCDWQLLVSWAELWLVLAVLHSLAVDHLQGQILIHSVKSEQSF